MHPNRAFRSADHAKDLALARARGFGTLILSGGGPSALPMVAHVPFLLSGDGTEVQLHLVRSNPVARVLGPDRPALLTVAGPDAYVSPDWYGIADQVPTWNYVAVHLSGRLERRPDAEMRTMLDAQSAAFEARLAPKPPWRLDKMSPDSLARLLRAIVPCRLHVEEIEATWKLNQNKPDAARLSAADRLGDGFGQEIAELAALMRAPPAL